jgi:DNA-directed RNA polymerase subunit RPC12/RpoP
MLLVRCPRCGHDMKYLPKPGLLSEKSKRCVYCGRNFKVHSSLPASRVVRVS